MALRDRENDKDRKFVVLLYEETESYNIEEVLDRLKDTFTEYSYCLHDLDIVDGGELKKAHFHVVGRTPSPVKIKTIANKLCIPENFIQFCSNWRKANRYLLHLDDPDKWAYDIDRVVSNFDFKKVVGLKDSVKMAKEIYGFIIMSRCTETRDLLKWVFENDCYSEFRRGYSVWKDLMWANRERKD